MGKKGSGTAESYWQKHHNGLKELWGSKKKGSVHLKSTSHHYNVAHFRAKTKSTRILMRELLFADDSAVVAHSAEEMQKIVDAFSDTTKTFGLGSNISSNGCIDDEIPKTNASFGRLRQRLWNNHHVSMRVKGKNKEMLERTGLPSVEDLLIRKNLRWTGHLMRMSPDRLPKQVLYSQLSSGTEREGALVSGSRIPSRETWSWET